MNIRISAYLDNNLGDDLMIKLVAKRFPDYNFIIYDNRTVIKNTFNNIKNIEVKDKKHIKKDMNIIDLYLSIGGSIFNIRTFREALSTILNILKLRKVKKNGIPSATIGANFGPYFNKKVIKLTELEVRLDDLIVVRDKDSYEKLESFKKIKSYYVADDIVYNIKSIMGVNKVERDGLGISAFRSIEPAENNFQNYQTLAKIANRYIERTNKKVKLFAFDTEALNDLSAAHHILSMIDNKENVEIVPYLGDEEIFLNKFKSCEVMIAVRFHSAILADIFEIPFLPIIYSNKMQNMLDDRKFKGKSIIIKDLKPSLNIDEITKNLVQQKNLFVEFMGEKNTSSVHFIQLDNLLKNIKTKKANK